MKIRLYILLIISLIKLYNNFDTYDDLRGNEDNYYKLIKSRKRLIKFFKYFSSIEYRGNKIVLYRGVRYKESELPLTKGLGYCWSFKYSKAYPYNGRSGPQDYFFVYHALVKLSDINWKETILKSLFYNSHEKEIAIKSDHPIQLIQIDKNIKTSPVLVNSKWTFPQNIESRKLDLTSIVN